MIVESMTLSMSVALFILALFAGIGSSAIGPGGIFITIALFLFIPITSSEVAGTASLTFVATGTLATALFLRSGDFTNEDTHETAIIVTGTGIIGAYTGSQVNFIISDVIFGYILSVFVAIVGGIIVYREANSIKSSKYIQNIPNYQRRLILSVVGFGIGFIGGLLGVGGPVIAVPVLVILGIPMLASLAIAQVQSIFISGFATAGYWIGNSVLLPLAILVGIPQLVGIVIGWRIAHLVKERQLRFVLGIVLVIISPIIAI